MNDAALEREALALFEAALDVPAAELPTWIEQNTAGRPELRARITALVSADSSEKVRTAGAFAAIEAEAVPSRLGAYRIIELIGRGGMGAVYLAERDSGDFSRTVAIKIIKPGIFSPDLVERFQRERQTLALLTHPNIARLYDGGETETGSPYIVMEYVDGAPLLDWARERNASRAERLRIFTDICDAVAFAHARLVVHRDLTPANVLVTAEGVAKLIDFGIARPADDAAREGGAAALTMTPGYAAPERMLGAPVTTSADIYSLGRLLDDLLAPKPDEAEIRAIIARACASEPQDRYPSVDALRADLDAWRTRQPVNAYSRKAGYRLRKFAARHSGALTASIAAFALLAGGLAVTLVANARAERARALAEERFEQTRAIANSMLFDVFDEVSNVSGTTTAREMLARTSLTYLEALAADPNAPVDVRVEAGLGFLRLAQVVGGGQASELGRYQDANALLAQAQSILEPLFEAHPQEPSVARAMATLLLEQSGAALYTDNDADNAFALAARARDILEPYRTEDVRAARQYIAALQAQADSYGWNDRYADALPLHQQAEAFAAALPPDFSGNIDVMRARGSNLRLMGDALHRLERTEEARITLERAVAQQRAVTQAAPNNPSYMRSLAIALWFSAVVHRSNGRDDAARATIEESVAVARRMRERDPNDAGAIRMVAISTEVYAQVLGDLRRFDESYAAGQDVIAAHRELVRRAGGAAGAKRSLAAALMTHGGNSYNAGAYPRACVAWDEGLAIYEELNAAGAMSDRDRTVTLAEAQSFVRRACNPPRAGLGPRI